MAPSGDTPPSYDDPGLLRWAEAAQPEELDELAFAVVRVDAAGVVRTFNRAAARVAPFTADGATGRHFYEEVAPDLAASPVRALITRALHRGALDVELGRDSLSAGPLHGFSGRMQPAADGGFWLFLIAS